MAALKNKESLDGSFLFKNFFDIRIKFSNSQTLILLTEIQEKQEVFMSLGITRKIDELGRIVVPKELRNTMNLKEGSLMEITANEDSIVMKKLSPLDRGREFAALIADTLSRQTDGAMVFVVSDDEIVAKCGKGSRDLDEIPEAVKHHIDKHRYSGGTVVAGTGDNAAEFVVTPISADGELYGHLVTTRNFSLSGELSKFAAALFSTYLG